MFTLNTKIDLFKVFEIQGMDGDWPVSVEAMLPSLHHRGIIQEVEFRLQVKNLKMEGC